MFTFPVLILPQLASNARKPPSGQNWIHEPKLDGYRLIAFKKGDEVHLFTRQQNDWTHRFKSLARAISEINVKELVLDGEVIVQNEQGLPDFQQLQNSLDGICRKPYKYFIFDFLYHNGKDLRPLPLIQRKSRLQKLCKKFNNEKLIYCEHYTMDGKQFFKKMQDLGLEGIVSKLANSPYIGKRSKYWIKTKCKQSDEFLVCGYTHADVAYREFGSLFLGKFENGKLYYCGNVGTGFSEVNMPIILKKLKKYEIDHCPFEKKPPDCSKAVWMKPTLLAEVEYSNITYDKLLRHPSFKAIREDKAALRDKKQTKQYQLNFQKEKDYKTFSKRYCNDNDFVYPAMNITKAQLMDYYSTIKKYIFPFISDRFLNLYRFPKNCMTGFYQRYAVGKLPKNIKAASLITQHGKQHDFFYVTDYKGYLTLPLLDTLEIHTWGSKVQHNDQPDFIVFDIDPGENITWKNVVATAFAIKEMMDDLHLKSYVKTTGGKGLHVVVPIKPEYDWNDILLFCKAIVASLIEQNPGTYTNQSRMSRSKNKIYIDCLRNNKCATAVVPFSLRAREGAPVATPLHWDELSDDARDTYFDIQTIFERLAVIKIDPWHDFFKQKQVII